MVFLYNAPIELLIPFTIAFFVLLIGSYTDLRTREVPDWVNFGLIGTGFGVNLLFAAIFWKLNFIINSIVGFAIFFILAWLMFRLGQWGGGDSKMLMGLGALFGIDVLSGEIPFLASFLLNALLIGALYGIFWSLYLISKNRNKFALGFRKFAKKKKIIKAKRNLLILFIILILLAFIVPDSFVRLILFYLALVSVFTFYLWISIKAVEESCMLKYVLPSQLTEGDWIAKDVKINGKYITGPKDLGIEKKKIRKLIELYKKKKVKKILIKEGIPFVPSFFIAFVITVIFGNLLFLLI